MPTQDVTLTAVFTPVVYEITYELNGGEIGEVNPESYTVESETITLASIIVSVIRFGWKNMGRPDADF